jgi:hypothetical protein
MCHCHGMAQARGGQTQTLAELQQLISALQKNKKLLQTQAAQHRASAQKTEGVRQEALSAISNLKVSQLPAPARKSCRSGAGVLTT